MERRGRILAILLLMGLGFALVALRLVYLQVFQRAELAARAERQQERLVKLEPKRGTIYDRMHRELAVSLDVDSIYGVPAEIENPRAIAQRLSTILHESPRVLERRLAGNKHFVWLSRKVEPVKAEKVKALGSREIGSLLESKRFYPKKTLAGPLIGFTGMDNEGLEGLERAYDKVLHGVSGWMIAEKDAVGRTVFPGGSGFRFRQPTKPGNDIVLTIDEVIQHITERELDAALASSHAKGGVCIVMNPDNGEVLALSVRTAVHERPAFNPNEPQRYKPADWRNRAVTDAFEPGSIFKPILASAALEERVVHPLERFDCSAGKIQVADRVIKDAHENGVLTFTDVIADSSNVGTIKVALRLGKERFSKYIAAFGFGQKTGVDIPGEISGLLKDYRLWSGVSIGSIAIGQEIGVTPMQMAAAYCALANGGMLVKPYIVSEIVDRDGGEGKKFGPQPVRRVISEETCAKVNKILQRVVESGTGQRAQLAGYTAAGKTGTAQKIDQKTGVYSKKDYLSSFVGFVPAVSPKLVILVMVDTPEGVVYGGSVAAPVFKAIAEQSLAYLQVAPDNEGGRMLLVTR
ncbi:MAG TPA: penicillin-binding transpeptidase domain-containing protein [Nitrospirota bacterium]|nr:penicillin-binding transpeptidase domain-containing protein [Nitrospirota bacterium]